MRIEVSARTELDDEEGWEDEVEVEAVVGGGGGWESERGSSWSNEGWEEGGV